MKQQKKYTLSLLVLIFTMSGIYAQDSLFFTGSERISLFTDRGMYISGEMIRFTACARHSSGSGEDLFSKVLYCELITPDGSRVAGGKYSLENSKSAGCLEIPGDLISGTYYLKAYTRYMRNVGPAAYQYSRVIIINPAQKEVLPSDTDGFPVQRSTDVIDAGPGGLFVLSTDRKIYSKRELVTVKVEDMSNLADSCRLLCCTVVPEFALPGPAQPAPGIGPSGDEVPFYPEIRGISLSGQLQDKATGLPLPGKKVNLSIIGDKDFMAIRTDSSGHFLFNLNGYHGSRDIFMCSEKVPGSVPVLMVDNDFCTKQLNLPSLPLRLSDQEKKTALEMASNCLVSSHFTDDTIENYPEDQEYQLSFYGNPTGVLILDKYIELPTLEEYFNELPGEVKVRKAQNQKFFRFYSTQTEMVIYDPLLLIDWVAVDDIDLVLSLSPRDISRIELFNAPYVKGQVMYGGIISFISRNNDFAGIDLPVSGTFINYSFFQSCHSKLPERSLPQNLPDTRNTVFWDPGVNTGPTGRTTISFTTPDTPGNYLILLRGVDQWGKEFSSSVRIEIL